MPTLTDGTLSYASVEDVLVTRRQGTQDAKYLAAVERYLADATDDITAALGGYSFLRSPETGTSTWITSGPGGDVLHLHEGVAELETVEIRHTTDDDWIELEAADWVLEGELGDPTIPAGEPAFHVVLLAGGGYPVYPSGRQLLRLTGARGWPTVRRARAATVAIVRQRLGLDQSGQGGQLGPEEFGSRVGLDWWPRVAYDFVQAEKGRHRGCSL